MVSVSKHEKTLRGMRCVISHRKPVTLHHCHGGSMLEHGWAVGMGQKQNPFLQIPLDMTWHTGHWGIDSGTGVQSWELMWGTQWSMLQAVNDQLPYDIFEEAHRWEDENRAKSQPSTTTKK